MIQFPSRKEAENGVESVEKLTQTINTRFTPAEMSEINRVLSKLILKRETLSRVSLGEVIRMAVKSGLPLVEKGLDKK